MTEDTNYIIPRRVALHEAGHGIAFCYYGRGFDCIEVYAKAKAQKTGEQAYCSASGTFSRYLSRREMAAEERQALRKEAFSDIVISLAGCAAERRYRKISIAAALHGYGQNDYEKALAVAAFIAEDDDDQKRLLDLSLKEAQRFVRMPVIWGAVNGVADLVQKHRRIRMTSRRVKAVVDPVLSLREKNFAPVNWGKHDHASVGQPSLSDIGGSCPGSGYSRTSTHVWSRPQARLFGPERGNA